MEKFVHVLNKFQISNEKIKPMNEKPTTNRLYQNVNGKIQQYCFIRVKGDKDPQPNLPEFKVNLKINETELYKLKVLEKFKDEK